MAGPFDWLLPTTPNELPNPFGLNPQAPINPLLPLISQPRIGPPPARDPLQPPGIGMGPPITSRRTGGGGQEFNIPPAGLFPQPTPIPPPKAAPMPADFDPSRAREFLSEAEPKEPVYGGAYTSDVLGGLARGLAGVDPTKPGSFAAALAGAGAGGAEARGGAIREGEKAEAEYQKQRTAFKTAQAGQEMQIARSEMEQKNLQQQVAQHNMDNLWKNEVENLKARDEYEREKYKIEQPQIIHDTNGITLVDRQRGKVEFHETRSRLETAEKTSTMLKALTPGDPNHDRIAVQLMMSDPDPNNPLPWQAKVGMAKEYMLRGMMNQGQMDTVFKKPWRDAYAAASKELEKDSNWTLMKATPAGNKEYISEVNKRAISKLLNIIGDDDGWVYDLAKQGNIIAKSMTGGYK